jgi:hypothetical protein
VIAVADSKTREWLKRRDEFAQRVALWINAGRSDAWLLDGSTLSRFERLLAERPPQAPEPDAELLAYVKIHRQRSWLRKLADITARHDQWERAGRPDSLRLKPYEFGDLQAWLEQRPADVSAPAADVLAFIQDAIDRSIAWASSPAPSRARNSTVASNAVAARDPFIVRTPPSEAPEPSGPTMHALKATDMVAAWLQSGRADAAPHVAVKGTDLVDVSVFAPPKAKPQTSIMVQVMLHTTNELKGAQARAALIDDAAVLRGNATLDILIPHGAKTMVMLQEPALQIAQPVQTIVWRGKLGVANFIVKVPAGVDGDLFPTVHVTVGAAVIGELRFKLTISSSDVTQQPNALQPTSPHRYRRAFFSYSSHDRVKALEVAQSYRLAGVEFFQDVLSLDPGARWERNLYREIDACDLFLLFWSRAASESEWVAREAKYALDRRNNTADQRPDLVPLVLEGPPVPQPPDFLSHLHFNDWMRLAIAAQSVR